MLIEKQVTKKTKFNITDSSNFNCSINSFLQNDLENTYLNKKWCFSVDYPKNWSYSEHNETTEAGSIDVVGFNDVPTDDLSFDKNKIVIKSYINYPIGLVADVVLLKDPKISHFRGLEDYRIQGNYRDSSQQSWVYSDTVYLLNYATNQVMTVSYYEKEHSEKNRKIFNDMLESLKFEQ